MNTNNLNILTAIEQLKQFSYLGLEEDHYSIRIGKAKHIAEFAWLHILYKAIDSDMIRELEEKLDRKIPSDYIHFLKITNGISIFSHSIALYGKRDRAYRSIEFIGRFPFSILPANTVEKAAHIPEDYFYIGSYSKDGSNIVMLYGTNEIFRLQRNTDIVLNKWMNLALFLKDEIARMSLLYNHDGRLINEKATKPVLKGIASPPTPQQW